MKAKVIFFFLFVLFFSVFLYSEALTEETAVFSQEGEDVFTWVQNGELDKLKTISSADLKSYVDEDDNTLLHYAAMYDQKDIVKYLLQIGLDLHSKNKQGKTPEDLARMFGCYRVLPLLHSGTSWGKYIIWGSVLLLILALAFYLKDFWGKTSKVVENIKEENNFKYHRKRSENPLVTAILQQKPSEVEKYIMESEENILESPDGNGITPLMAAIRVKSAKWTEMLLHHGVKADTATLNEALKAKHFKVLKLLWSQINKEALEDIYRSDWICKFLKDTHWGAEEKKEILNLIFLKTKNVFNWCSKENPFLILLEAKAIDTFSFLLKKVDSFPVRYGTSILEELLKQKADDNLIEMFLKKMKDINLEVISILLKYKKTGLVEELIKNNPQLLQAKDEHGQNIIHYLVKEKEAQLVKKASLLGADINLSDNDGYFPLLIAIFMNDIETFKILLERGADIRKKLSHDRTLLHIASEKGNLEMCRILVQAGLSPNVSDSQGEYPLTIALKKKNEDLVAYFKSITDLNLEDRDGVPLQELLE